LKKSSKNILIAHSSNDLYGASKVLISTIEILILNGFNVHLILPYNGPLNYNETIKKVNLSIINLGVFRKKYFNIFGLFNRLFYVIKSTFDITNYIKKNKIDLIFINTSTIISPCISSYISKTPSIYHIHEIPKGSAIYLKFLIKVIDKFSNRVIAVSNAVKEYWVQNGLNEDNILVIYNGYDFDFRQKKIKDKNKVIFTSISRIIPYKGHMFLIELFKRILILRKDVILQIVGDTLPAYQSYLNKLKLKVKEYKLENNIFFLGFIPSIKPALQNSDFFIHTPVEPDPAPAVILEAIESRTAVIYSDLGGAKEILDNGKNGLRIDLNSVQKSSKIIIDYISNYDIHEKRIEEGIDFIKKNFNKESYKNKLINLLSEF
jgi:glycosyltransferase involved in cell wall biosynthesis